MTLYIATAAPVLSLGMELTGNKAEVAERAILYLENRGPESLTLSLELTDFSVLGQLAPAPSAACCERPFFNLQFYSRSPWVEPGKEFPQGWNQVTTLTFSLAPGTHKQMVVVPVFVPTKDNPTLPEGTWQATLKTGVGSIAVLITVLPPHRA